MAGGIRLVNCSDTIVNGNIIVGADVGVDFINCKDITANDNSFLNVKTAIRADGIDGLEAKRNSQKNGTKMEINNSIREKTKEHRGNVYRKEFGSILTTDALEFCMRKLREGM